MIQKPAAREFKKSIFSVLYYVGAGFARPYTQITLQFIGNQ
jgi:hypothetical protein